jgi:hypothetical protein
MYIISCRSARALSVREVKIYNAARDYFLRTLVTKVSGSHHYSAGRALQNDKLSATLSSGLAARLTCPAVWRPSSIWRRGRIVRGGDRVGSVPALPHRGRWQLVDPCSRCAAADNIERRSGTLPCGLAQRLRRSCRSDFEPAFRACSRCSLGTACSCALQHSGGWRQRSKCGKQRFCRLVPL